MLGEAKYEETSRQYGRDNIGRCTSTSTKTSIDKDNVSEISAGTSSVNNTPPTMKRASIRLLKISLGKLIKKSIELRMEASMALEPKEALAILQKIDSIRERQVKFAIEILSREGFSASCGSNTTPSTSISTLENQHASYSITSASHRSTSNNMSFGFESFSCDDNKFSEFDCAAQLEEVLRNFSSHDIDVAKL